MSEYPTPSQLYDEHMRGGTEAIYALAALSIMATAGNTEAQRLVNLIDNANSQGAALERKSLQTQIAV